MGSCNVSIFQYISNKMQRYIVYLYLETALHVSGGTSTHHQERIQLYLQHLVFVTPLLLLPLSWKSWNRFECAVGGVCALQSSVRQFSMRETSVTPSQNTIHYGAMLKPAGSKRLIFCWFQNVVWQNEQYDEAPYFTVYELISKRISVDYNSIRIRFWPGHTFSPLAGCPSIKYSYTLSTTSRPTWNHSTKF
jgi:hypothetical protein